MTVVTMTYKLSELETMGFQISHTNDGQAFIMNMAEVMQLHDTEFVSDAFYNTIVPFNNLVERVNKFGR